LSPTLFAVLCVISLANHLVFAEAAYLRAYKQEPFMIISVLNAIATTIFALLTVPHFGTAGATFTYALTTLLISLVGGTTIFFRKRREYSKQ